MAKSLDRQVHPKPIRAGGANIIPACGVLFRPFDFQRSSHDEDCKDCTVATGPVLLPDAEVLPSIVSARI